ncbi:regulator of G-protein signaling 9-binding protein-like isoform X2 [Liolophura sinensis]
MGLGTTQDSDTLRDELKRTRCKICDLARKTSASLVTLVKNNSFNTTELPDLERLYRMFSACLEVVEAQMYRTITLMAAFPLHSANTVLIHTGLTEAVFAHKFCVSLEHLDTPKVDRKVIEKEEMKILQRDVSDIHELLYDINQKMDVKPWATETTLNMDKYENAKKTDCPDMDSSSIGDMGQASETGVTGRRRCACFVCISVVIVVVIGTAAGICIPLLLRDR